MENMASPILAAVLVFGTMAHAVPQGAPEGYRLKTKYECETSGVAVRSKTRLLNPKHEAVVQFAPTGGESSILTFGDNESMLWPKSSVKSFEKTLMVMTRTGNGQFIIAQEIDLGDEQKTQTRLNVPTKTSDVAPVSCKVEMEWVKR